MMIIIIIILMNTCIDWMLCYACIICRLSRIRILTKFLRNNIIIHCCCSRWNSILLIPNFSILIIITVAVHVLIMLRYTIAIVS